MPPSQPGKFSRSVGRAYLTLGRALEAVGRVGDAQAALASARVQLSPMLGEEHPETREARRLADSSAATQ